MALGRRDAQIAAQIGGTEAQVSVQRLRLLRKLKIHSLAQLVDAAERLAKWPSSPIAPPSKPDPHAPSGPVDGPSN
ncbi:MULTISPECIES: LuxR C-terminal-related transcriptional regulator [Bradyrhizobium]|uniref:LuxR C-terminal-related transcriptional regulator n=1 Tax=Bradyrhizobium TaxID=374 RepID=UPI000A0350E8|nr:hypothetical protein G6P99_42385 [Bradyrhizobium sp. 6(2017)]